MASKSFDFGKTAKAIMNASRGQERNMYPRVRDLLIHALNHSPDSILTDTAQQSGGSPDLIVRADTGIEDAKGRAITSDWVVVEVKDEPQAFSDAKSRERIFNEKAKYITPGTEWFVMIDPRLFIARPVAMRSQLKIDPGKDIVLEWQGLSEQEFRKKLSLLCAQNTADSPSLRAFRRGESEIAVVKVDLPPQEKSACTSGEKARLKMARGDFLKTIEDGTAMLQNACARALMGWEPRINLLRGELDGFKNRWDDYELRFSPVDIRGKNVCGADEFREHDEQAMKLAQLIRETPAVAKLADRALPAYFHRVGKRDAKSFAAKGDTEAFTAESANLILARILLLRFFEDHGFFREKRYVCNGGVAALQEFMRYYERGYVVLLEAAYKKGGTVYADAFDTTDLDWVLESDDIQVSRAVELTMMRLSRFDFATVSGDILSGIYDRFMNRAQRKKLGEFYTPPSVARYIVKRLGIKSGDRVFDPACGSGTFLLEAFARMTGNDIRDGRGSYQQAEATLANIGGNDLNPFSAVMSRIQMLWHLLPLKEHLKIRGDEGKRMFPEILISDSFNALIRRGLSRHGSAFEKLDYPMHDFVVGNPPYVRPERALATANGGDENFFKEIGGTKKNLYDLFVYKALVAWCRPANGKQKPGRIGFVVPLSFCDNDNSAPLRKLFAPGGRFRIVEITDMEAIAPHVFDAAVNPIILLAENRPPRKSDKITIRTAGAKCILDADNREFNIDRATSAVFRYEDVWADDGRILTKLTQKRKSIIDKMAGNQTLADIARVFWQQREQNTVIKWRADKPQDTNELNGEQTWTQDQMIRLGASFRREWQPADDDSGLDFYKGENIRACRVEGEPVKKNILPDSVSTPSLWKFRDILPHCGYAFSAIALGVNAARFNPQKCVFMDTAVVFVPNTEWENFPIDAALLSRLYQFYWSAYLRKGALSHSYRSHLYPSNLRMLPVPASILGNAKKLEKLRGEFLQICKNIGNRGAALELAMEQAGAMSLAAVCRAKKIKIRWSGFMDKNGKITLTAPRADSVGMRKQNGTTQLSLDGQLALDDSAWLALDNEQVARHAAAALTVLHGRGITRDDLLKMNIPKSDAAFKKFINAVNDYDKGGEQERLEKTLDAIDAIVGAAFKLSDSDIKFVRKEMNDDDFLRRIRPNLPFSGARQRGLLGGLSDADRYKSE